MWGLGLGVLWVNSVGLGGKYRVGCEWVGLDWNAFL